ncbi:MAG: hypothetical protein AAF570_29335, partial [Bacteroidota bacterium]
ILGKVAHAEVEENYHDEKENEIDLVLEKLESPILAEQFEEITFPYAPKNYFIPEDHDGFEAEYAEALHASAVQNISRILDLLDVVPEKTQIGHWMATDDLVLAEIGKRHPASKSVPIRPDSDPLSHASTLDVCICTQLGQGICEPDEGKRILENALQALKPGGHLLLHTAGAPLFSAADLAIFGTVEQKTVHQTDGTSASYILAKKA